MTFPAEKGYAAAPDWANHARCWMAWPCLAERWGDHLEGAQDAFSDVAAAVSQFEPVTMITRPEHVAEVSLRGSRTGTLPLMHDDARMRDTGPCFLAGDDGTVAGLSWRFNGWGDQVSNYGYDASLAAEITRHLGLDHFEADLVAEGSAYQVDGDGTLIATEQCLLDPKRNPGLSREEVETRLQRYLGVTKVVWLARGLVEDRAPGHVDNLVCFARPGVLLALGSRDKDDPNHAILEDNLERLRSATDAQGRSFEIHVIEQPKPRKDGRGGRLCLSYVNLYLANGGVVLPAFEDPMDERAAELIEEVLPDRAITHVPAVELAHGGMGIHNITLGQPEGPAKA
jgi:agmatine deiminase